MTITKDILVRLWPKAKPDLIRAVCDQATSVFEKYGINTPLRVAHFMAQVSHESNGGTVTAENMNYTTAGRIAAVWPSRFTSETALAYVRNPKKLASEVYNSRMGNRPGTDDGYNYRGRGLLQLTGRESYQDMATRTGLDLVNSPDLAFSPEHALEIAAAEFAKLGALPFCDRDDLNAVTRRVNGGLIGLDSRKAWLAKWKMALPELPGPMPRTKAGLNDVDKPAPRAADPVAVPAPMAKSRIGNGALAGGGLSIAATIATIWEKVTEAPESLLNALVAVAQKPSFWIALGIVGVCGFIWWQRYRLKQDAGV